MNKPTIDSRSSQRYGNNSSPTNSTDSAPIPLPRTHLHRTRSEVALEEANKLADWRENQMYLRLLTGMIRRSQEKGLDQNPKIIRSMENLVQTQASPISSLDNSSKNNEEWGIISCSPDENQGARNSHDPHSSSSKNLSSVSSWNSAMSGGYSSSSLSRRPSRIRLSLTTLRESLKASFKDEGIFDLEM
mmetsp:Transcript_14857/g.22866  ORF Transcript_14857/g.22866 Transcript_14857/m.22866 type:complete len:189 (-) Transcript_14857:96-662(-)